VYPPVRAFDLWGTSSTLHIAAGWKPARRDVFKIEIVPFPCRFRAAQYASLGLGRVMIEDTIGKIEAKIQSAEALKEEKRRELTQLLGTLKAEVAELSKTHQEQAESIAGFAEVSTHEATRAEQNPHLLRLSLEGLSSSVAELRESHPRLVQLVNTISNMLSNLGI
jgi:hypothetical protein